ncbi:hypothetical protein RJ53_02380 [Methanocalculus chunghsingensis]|uniref:Flagellin n=1 Tax=Methanocalculus chunghsingensis TaxID=156457 RepID=A0A8J7W946_9EURY|nr:flagellin [Methanocalculus chunghsingensis]MBR1368407.1 hypothetical protein [Methanocalculus chunghsingensis]
MKLQREEDAFTGLEAAIVLIAFIVVAAVFSYVMLGAGFFTTQKSQETVYSAIGQAATNLEVSGPVVLKTSGGSVEQANFTLILAAGGVPVDLKKVTYTLSTQDQVVDFGYYNVSIRKFNVGVENQLLERGEIAEVGLVLDDTGRQHIQANQPFTIEVKPSTGASLPITRYAPLSFKSTGTAYYEVY